ncbi:rab-GTPase-TBC domain-containing protein [Spinellus fusiger]|nr:rab-GTPase-TBC domain-containing protein [Spinellus fusiger]
MALDAYDTVRNGRSYSVSSEAANSLEFSDATSHASTDTMATEKTQGEIDTTRQHGSVEGGILPVKSNISVGNDPSPAAPQSPPAPPASSVPSASSVLQPAPPAQSPTQPTPMRRRRAMTVTQNGRPQQEIQGQQTQISEDESESEQEQDEQEQEEIELGRSTPNTSWEEHNEYSLSSIHHQIHDLHDISSSIAEESESDSEDVLKRLPHHSHRSTMSSVSSFVSSASNYDLLLARLGAHESAAMDKEDIEIPLDRVYTESTLKGEEDIDWEFWSKVISDFHGVAKSEPKVLSYHIQRGIPPSLRGMVWELFAKSKDTLLEDQYLGLLKEESVYEKAIARDLPRTFSDHEYFQSKDGQEALFNVIKAYSLYDREVGYSQGVAFIAGPLLLNMPEEEAFCVLVQLMSKYELRGHFSPQPDLLSQRLFQLDGLLADHLPHVRRHFEVHGIQAHMYASQWFLTLFAYKFPLEVVFRLYDVFFSQGMDAIYRFALALIEKNQSLLLSLESDQLLPVLKGNLLEAYSDNISLFIHDAFEIKILPKRLEKLAKEYQIEAARANTEAEAIETMRRQNKALTETVQQLETHLKDLNKEHQQVATALITTKMEIARFHDENDALHQQSHDLKKALETMPFEVEQRIKDEMEVLATKNAALVERNSALEDQLAYMENMVIEIKVKYAESENEREALKQRLTELKRLMG